MALLSDLCCELLKLKDHFNNFGYFDRSAIILFLSFCFKALLLVAPLAIKPLRSTQRVGVALAWGQKAAESVIEGLMGFEADARIHA